jgi:hypothetical protein
MARHLSHTKFHSIPAILLIAGIMLGGAHCANAQSGPTSYRDCTPGFAFSQCMKEVERAQKAELEAEFDRLEARSQASIDRLQARADAIIAERERELAPKPRPAIGAYGDRLFINGVYLDLRHKGACEQLVRIVKRGEHLVPYTSGPLPSGYGRIPPVFLEEVAEYGDTCKKAWKDAS